MNIFTMYSLIGSIKMYAFTFFTKKDDKNIPAAAKPPPIKVVNRMPILLVSRPATGDKKNVIPIVREPTNAVIK